MKKRTLLLSVGVAALISSPLGGQLISRDSSAQPIDYRALYPWAYVGVEFGDDRWYPVYVDLDSDRAAVIWLATDRITALGPSQFHVWYMSNYRDERTPQTGYNPGSRSYTRVVQAEDVDCNGKRVRYHELYRYRNGEVVESFPRTLADAWEDTIPQTIGEDMIEMTCAYIRSHRRTASPVRRKP